MAAARGTVHLGLGLHVLVTCLLWSLCSAGDPFGEFVFEESTPSLDDAESYSANAVPEYYYANTAFRGRRSPEFFSGRDDDVASTRYSGDEVASSGFYADSNVASYGDSVDRSSAGYYGDTGVSDYYTGNSYPEADLEWDSGEVAVAAAAPANQFVQTRGRQFWLNGRPLYVNGVNLYYLMTLGSDPNRRYLVTQILKECASVGATVVRAWAFADGDGAWNLQTRPGVYSENTFRGLDFTVSEARKYGVRLILSFVNNYPDYGGRQKYVQWAQQYGGNWNAKLDDFYTDGTIRQWYKNHIKKVITRVNTITRVMYRDDPTIFSWELINEPRCESDQSGFKLQNWIKEMAAFVKSLDRKHMLEVGLEGFFSSRVHPSSSGSQSANPASFVQQFGTDFVLNNIPVGIDFTTVHSYPDSWVPNQPEYRKRNFMASWIRAHINDAQYQLKKPVLFAEFGRSDKAAGYNPSYRFADMTNMYNAVYASARTGGAAAGAMVWQFAPQALKSSVDDGYVIVLSQQPAIAILVKMHSARMSRL